MERAGRPPTRSAGLRVAAELALGVPLTDPTGELSRLRAQLVYPDTLRRALVANLWEAEFLVQIAGKAVALRDDAYLAACRSRAVLLCAHALHAIDGRWLVTEKGAVASAAASPWAPRLFAERVVAALGDEDEASRLVAEVRRRCDEALSCPSRGLDRLDRRTT